MTAAEVKDVIARVPDCAGQAADEVSFHSSKNGRCSKIVEMPKSECPDIWIRLPGHTWQSHGQTLKILWFFLNEICMVTHLQASCGKDNVKKLQCNENGKKYRSGSVHLFIENKDYSSRHVWLTQ